MVGYYMRVLVRSFVSLSIVTLLTLAHAAAARADRVGFANVARDGAAGQAAIDALRDDVLAARELEDLGDGAARRALEEPVDLEKTAERAAVAHANTALADAKSSFTRFEYDEALGELRLAEAVLRTVNPTADVVSALADVNLLVGLAHAGRKDEARALEAFRLVRNLAPDRSALDPGLYKPQIVALYEKAGEADGAPGLANVSSEPSGATVWIDGRAVGPAPIELPTLAAGDHYLTATLDGHAPRTERIRIESGKGIEQSLLLSRLPADERARTVRAGLLAPGVVEADWKRAAGILAAWSVDVLVIVRQQESGTLEVAVYDARQATLSPWIEGGDPARVVKELPTPRDRSIALPTPEDLAKKKVGGEGPPIGGKKPVKTPWYKTGRGLAVLGIGAGVLLVAGAVFIASPSGSTEIYDPTGGFTWADF